MKSVSDLHPRARKAACVIALAVLGPSPTHAQSALFVGDLEHEYRLVHAMANDWPNVMEKGKLQGPGLNGWENVTLVSPTVGGGGLYPGLNLRYKLEPVAEYFPAFVQVKIERAAFTRAGTEHVHRLGQEFSFAARFSSDFRLSWAFFVLEFNSKNPARRIYAYGLKSEELRSGALVSVNVPLSDDEDSNSYSYKLHILSEGLEVFNSEMPRSQIDEALGRMVAKRTAGVTEAAAKPLTGPKPRYPEKLSATKATGRAVISCVIAPTGQPTQLAIKSATEPAFGDAALAVMSQWWFVPAVANGQPVATRAELPFEFAPPKS